MGTPIRTVLIRLPVKPPVRIMTGPIGTVIAGLTRNPLNKILAFLLSQFFALINKLRPHASNILFCIFLILPSFIFSNKTFSQKPAMDLGKFNLKIDFTVPRPVSNPAYKKYFKGILKWDLGLTYNFGKGVFAGINGEFSRFNFFRSNITGYSFKRINYAAGAKIGYQYNSGDRTLMAFSLDINHVWALNKRYKCPEKDESVFNPQYLSIEPGWNVYFKVDENFFLGFNLSYNYHLYSFSPSDICLEKFNVFIDPNDSKGNISHINFGFGFIYNFKKGEGFE